MKHPIAYFFALILKIGGLGVLLVGLFASNDRLQTVISGLTLIGLGLFVNLLERLYDQPRWNIGIHMLVWSAICFFLPLNIMGEFSDQFFRNAHVARESMLLWKALALVILFPLFVGVMRNPAVLSRLGAFWLRGFQLILLTGLIVLPAALFYKGSQLIVALGYVEEGSRMGASLYFLGLGLSLVLAPFLILPFLRWLAASPLGRSLVNALPEGLLRGLPEATTDVTN